MIPIEKKTVSGNSYVICLPDDKDKVVEVRFRINNEYMSNVLNNQVLIQLSRDINDKDILEVIKTSLNEITSRGYNVSKKMIFEVNSIDDMKIFNNIANMGFGDIIKGDKSSEYYDNIFKSYLATKTIQKMDNGRIVNYVIANEDSKNGEFVLAGVDINVMEQAFQELNISSGKELFDKKTPEEVSNIVLNYIADRDNLKRYMLGERNDVDTNDRVGSVVQNVSTMDDKVNQELGIIKNDVKDRNTNGYQAVSVNGEEVNVSEINPGMINASVSSNGKDNYSNSVNNQTYFLEQNSEEYTNFYLDDDSNLYDKDGNIICNINSDNEYRVDYVNNGVYYNGVMVGVLDDYRTMGINQEIKKENTLKRVLVPDNNNSGIIKITIMGVLLGVFSMLIVYLMVR